MAKINNIYKDEPDTFDFVKVNVLDDKTRNSNNSIVRYRGFLSVWQKKIWTCFLSLSRGWLMLDLSKIENIYLAPGATDLRKSIDGCSNIVQYQMFLDSFNPSIFIFCNWVKTTTKILEWNGNDLIRLHWICQLYLMI